MALMFKIEISALSSLNDYRKYYKIFNTKKEANKWFKKQEIKRSVSRNFGSSFSNDTIEVRKLY